MQMINNGHQLNLISVLLHMKQQTILRKYCHLLINQRFQSIILKSSMIIQKGKELLMVIKWLGYFLALLATAVFKQRLSLEYSYSFIDSLIRSHGGRQRENFAFWGLLIDGKCISRTSICFKILNIIKTNDIWCI